MELLSNLQLGFDVALSLQNVLYCFVGVLLGTLIGVLPGIGPVATIAMLLPATFSLPPVSALLSCSRLDAICIRLGVRFSRFRESVF